MQKQDILTTLIELTDDQRLDAREQARRVMLRKIGDKPQRSQFAGTAISEYPRWVKMIVVVVMAIVFIAAAMPSLFRLYAAGSGYHFEAVGIQWQSPIVGISTFMLSEFLIITSTLAASIFYKGRARALFIIPIGLGLAMAFVGNWTVVKPHDLFSWLETVVPPLSVLFMSFVGERLLLDSVKQQHADELAYQQSAVEWEQATRDVEVHREWRVVYGRALMQALKESNGQGAGQKARREFMAQMGRKDWAVVVGRELAIEEGAWLLDSRDDSESFRKEEPAIVEATPPVKALPFGNTALKLGGVEYMQTTAQGNGLGTIATSTSNNF